MAKKVYEVRTKYGIYESPGNDQHQAAYNTKMQVGETAISVKLAADQTPIDEVQLLEAFYLKP